MTSESRRVPAPPPDDVGGAGPDADPDAVARKILLDYLTGRARSTAELRKKLADKSVPDEVAERMLERFTEVGLVDDQAFADAWVSSRQSGKGLAPRALASELRRKGVADDVARQALDRISVEDQESAARALVQRKLRSVARLDRAVATRRLVGMLARKGYGQGLAFAVVKDALGEIED